VAPQPSQAHFPTSAEGEFLGGFFVNEFQNHSRQFAGLFYVVFMAVYLLFALPATAQNTTGRIVGTITDQSNASVGGAKVTVTNTGTNVSSETTADAEGAFQVLDLPVGNYKVAVQKEGFGTAVTSASELQINQTLRIDVHLTVGAVTQSVAVEAQAAQVETEVPTVGGTVTGAPIQNLPLNGRDVLDLALTQPGVVPAQPSNNEWFPSSYSIAGGLPNSINYILDGGDNTSLLTNAVVLNPNPDTIAEFRILTNNYTAEYGRNGGGIISVVMKSGSNQPHGSLFEYVRNEDFDASDYFSNAAGLPRPILKRNQFGGTFGGPIIIPKLVNGRDKLFFFFGYQGQRQSQVVVNPAVQVFTPAELVGNFSQALNGGPDPSVVKFLQANPYFQSNPALAARAIINPATINPVSQNIINAGEIQVSPNGIQIPQGSSTDNRNEYFGKIDFNATQNDRITATVGYANDDAIVPFGGFAGNPNTGFPSLAVRDQRGINIAYTKLFGPTLINELRTTAQRYLQTDGLPTRVLPSPNALGITGINTQPVLNGGTVLSFDSGMQVGNNEFPIALFDTTYAFSDTLTWTRGRHTIKAGFTFNISQNNAHIYSENDGVYSFIGPGGVGSGNSFADFLFGLPASFSQSQQAVAYPRSKGYWAFVQDEWKVTPRLLLTLGLRYEYNTPAADKRGLTVEIIPGLQSQRFTDAPPGVLVPGDPGAPNSLWFPYKAEIAPRFGFAWDPTGKGRTSLRGGFGIFDDDLSAMGIFWNSAQAPWFDLSYVPYPAPVSPITGTLPYMAQPYASAGVPNPFPYPASPPSNLNWGAQGLLPYAEGSTSPYMKPGYIYQWNLSLQQQIGNSLVAEVSYIGNSAHRLPVGVQGDPEILGTGIRLLNAETTGDCTPYDCFSHFTLQEPLGHSNYNGLVSSLNKRVGDWHSLGETFYTVSYTWSHMLNNSDNFQGSGTNEVPYYNHNEFYGNAQNDVRQRFVMSAGWEIPFAHLWSSGPKRLTSGWRLFPIWTKQSGSPLDVLAKLSNGAESKPGPSGAGDSNLVRANLAGSGVQTYNPTQVQTINGVTGNFFFNPNSFAPNPASWSSPTYIPAPDQRTYGTYPRNSVYGPGWSNLDLSLEKKVPLFGERVQGAFRIEAFNVLNHPEFWLPNTNPTSSTFGEITSVNPSSPSRIIQLALRLNF
jgi:hypothetical protein